MCKQELRGAVKISFLLCLKTPEKVESVKKTQKRKHMQFILELHL